ncbi:hypothetical protein WJX84_006070 [Apatococcus fuscideae]|uniref:BING4 C-terminal domain-containing protein n=1 Tax=Apatococcus fuscideae TaxID=2026836 RepID=A0AAW1TGQ6_9CHLO
MVEAGEQLGSQPRKRQKVDHDKAARIKKFRRGDPLATSKIPDKKLKGNLRYQERLANEAAELAAKADEWLLPGLAGALEADGMERTWRFKQDEVVREAEVGAARKVFDLSLTELGPYSVNFTRSGRFLALGGRKGHLAVMDWQRGKLITEIQVKETTRDIQFLHNETFFAAAQRKYVYIYDRNGVEVHCLKEHVEANCLDFLPHHFLLCSVGHPGVLRYQDTSTGQTAAAHRTRLGPCSTMRQNPWNAVLCLGHAAGTVTMWAPNMATPLVRLLCHRGPVKALAIDRDGHNMVTAGADGQVRVWDLRMLRPRHAYFSRATPDRLDISQRGLLAVGAARSIQVWQGALEHKVQSPYMRHDVYSGRLHDLAFCPYEDVLAAGHSEGLSTMLVPGAGEPNYDSRVADPFQGRKAKREQEVAQLLDKLQPDMIVLDPTTIGQVRKEPKQVQEEARLAALVAERTESRAALEKQAEKKKMKGKNKPSKRHRKKQYTIIEEHKVDAKGRAQKDKEFGKTEKNAEDSLPDDAPRALAAFYQKGRK